MTPGCSVTTKPGATPSDLQHDPQSLVLRPPTCSMAHKARCLHTIWHDHAGRCRIISESQAAVPDPQYTEARRCASGLQRDHKAWRCALRPTAWPTEPDASIRSGMIMPVGVESSRKVRLRPRTRSIMGSSAALPGCSVTTKLGATPSDLQHAHKARCFHTIWHDHAGRCRIISESQVAVPDPQYNKA